MKKMCCVLLLAPFFFNLFFIYFLFIFIFLFIYFLKSLLVACPTHTNSPGSGLGTGGIVFDKHIEHG